MPGIDAGIAGYWQWQKALNADGLLCDIAVAARKTVGGGIDIRYVAICIAEHGASGRGCFATLETLAHTVGCDRKVIQRYRKQLIDLGWFTVTSRNGGNTRRALVLDIAIPGATPDPWTAEDDLPMPDDTEDAPETAAPRPDAWRDILRE